MPAFSRLVPALALCLAAVALHAATPYVPIEQQLDAGQRRETGIDTLAPAQLELLNRLLREKAQAAAASDSVANREDTTDKQRGENTADSSELPRAVPMDLEIRTIKSRLKGPVSGWEPGTEFQLENGQRWKVLKGQITLRETLLSPEILVVPGLAGRWFLQVDEDYPKARVYRID